MVRYTSLLSTVLKGDWELRFLICRRSSHVYHGIYFQFGLLQPACNYIVHPDIFFDLFSVQCAALLLPLLATDASTTSSSFARDTLCCFWEWRGDIAHELACDSNSDRSTPKTCSHTHSHTHLFYPLRFFTPQSGEHYPFSNPVKWAHRTLKINSPLRGTE